MANYLRRRALTALVVLFLVSIISFIIVFVLPGDTAESLAERVLVQEHRLYPAVLRRFAAGEREPVLLTG